MRHDVQHFGEVVGDVLFEPLDVAQVAALQQRRVLGPLFRLRNGHRVDEVDKIGAELQLAAVVAAQLRRLAFHHLCMCVRVCVCAGLEAVTYRAETAKQLCESAFISKQNLYTRARVGVDSHFLGLSSNSKELVDI